MACTPPSGTSPGFLRVDYYHVTQGRLHGTRARLQNGIDPLDSGLMATTAENWAEKIADITTANFRMTGFTVMRADGTIIYDGSFASAIVGTHVLATGGKDLRSLTVAFTGKGLPAAAGLCSGEEVSRVFCGGAFEWDPGQGFIIAGLDASCDLLALFLRTNVTIWADAYGQKASCRSRYPVQLNGYAQNHYGT